MINTEKVRLMTQCAIYEKHDGTDDLKIAKFFRADYIRLEVLKTILGITFGYFFLLTMIVIYYLEFLIKNALQLNYKMLGMRALAYYILLIAAYIVFAVGRYSYLYMKSHKRLGRYYRMLGKIKKIAEEQEYEKELEEENWEEMQA
ncbi:MAG: hypothetical protein J5872_02115 [Lachnospiraceae bacterium]|nr:hypothetical protein [Lachnospiraceae bacterium]